MIPLPEIDTLRLCSLLNTTAFGFVFLLLWRGRREDDHLLYCSLSSFLYGAVMIGFGIWGEKGIFFSTIFGMLLAVSNILPVVGLRHFQGRPLLEAWMAVPPLTLAFTHVVPVLLMRHGWLPPEPMIGRICDIIGLIVEMIICGSVMIAGPLRGQRIAGAATLAYVPVYMLTLAGEITTVSGAQPLSLLPLVADQVLLGILNLGLLILPFDRAQDKLREAALRDPLTGVWNRAGLEVEKERLIAPGAAVIAIDVDHFKAVNDQHGHEAGDAVLRGIAQEAARIAEAEEGALARLGGDEFVLLLPAECEGQRRIAEGLMRQCREGAPSVGIWSLSMGFAQVEDEDAGFDAAFRRADEALYRAKAGGRNRLVA